MRFRQLTQSRKQNEQSWYLQKTRRVQTLAHGVYEHLADVGARHLKQRTLSIVTGAQGIVIDTTAVLIVFSREGGIVTGILLKMNT